MNGWGEGYCGIYARFDRKWGKIHLVFVAKGFGDGDYYRNYGLVMDYLEQRLRDDPDLFTAISLVIKTPSQADEGGMISAKRNYSQV
jgi:hypothetical protein